tara:strand:- start:1610 stop:1885 length:276 start_codon:yes stop_codon:yes gene_type:complete
MSTKRGTRAAPKRGVVYLTEDGPVQEDPLKDDAFLQRLSMVRKEAHNAARRMYFDRNVSLGFCRGLPAPEVDADWDAFNARVVGRHYNRRG